jgi:hypothetical protein
LSGLLSLAPSLAGAADDNLGSPAVQEKIWALSLTLPTLAYVVHPVGNGPFPLVIMNHGVSLNVRDRSFFYTGASGDAEYHLMPPFGSEGHFFLDQADAIPLWAPLVARFLDQHP